jgi:predicted oxidoreductase
VDRFWRNTRRCAGWEVLRVDAQAVVVCTGGFAANHELMRKVAPNLRELPRLLTGGAPGALGHGHRLLCRAGAQFTCLDHIWTYPNGTPDPDDTTGTRGVGVRGVAGDIWLNSAGRRFVDERNCTGGSGARAMLAQPDQTAWSIFNAAELTKVVLLGNDAGERPRRSTQTC